MAEKTFETAVARLEEITEELESGDISLEESLKRFSEGVKLAAWCEKELEQARLKVEMLTREDGSLKAEPFATDSGTGDGH